MRVELSFVGDNAVYRGDTEAIQSALAIPVLRITHANGVAINASIAAYQNPTVRFDCPPVARLDYTNKTAVANAWADTQNSGIMDSLNTQFFTLDNCTLLASTRPPTYTRARALSRCLAPRQCHAWSAPCACVAHRCVFCVVAPCPPGFVFVPKARTL